MAEVLGVVASGIAVADLVMNVVSGLVTLKGLWDQVKDVPAGIDCLMVEIEILLPLIEGNSFEGSEPAKSYALKVVQQLAGLVSDLDRDIRSAGGFRRHMAKFRVVLKADILSKYEARLQSSVRLLMMAQQCHLISLQQSQPDVVVRKLLDNLPTQSSRCSDESDPVQDGLDHLLVSHAIAGYPSRPTELAKTSSQTTFSLPFLGYQFHLKRSYAGWQFNLRPYGIIPHNSKSRDLILKGDTEGLFRLFDTGEASPYDKASNGENYLFAAIHSPNPTILQRLLELGLDPYEKNNNGSSWLHWGFTWILKSDIKSSMRIFLFAIDQGFDSDMLTYFERIMSSDMSLFRIYVDTQVRRQVYTTAMIFRTGFSGLAYYGHPSQIRYMLQQAEKYSQPPKFKPDPSRHYHFYECLISGYCYRWLISKGFTDQYLLVSVDEWGQLVREYLPLNLITQWAHAYFPPKRGIAGCYCLPASSPLFTFMANWTLEPGSTPIGVANYTKQLRFWATEVYRSGAHLKEYGRMEKQAQDYNNLYYQIQGHLYPSKDDSYLQLCSMHTGPLPEDWYFEWDPPLAESVGDFFRLVEDPLWNRCVPGSWPDM